MIPVLIASRSLLLVAHLLGAVPASALPEDPERTRVAAARAAWEADLLRLRSRVAEEERALLDSWREVEFPLSERQQTRAQAARALAGRLDNSRTLLRCEGGPPRDFPLEVFLANYTLDVNGQPIPGSEGWTSEERKRFSRFLCRALPVARTLYGRPFQRWPVTLVKDLYYQGSWIFIPSTLEIHTNGDWNPRLLVHEFLHAYRGRRTLTSNASWSYDPTLSGFEEGFAEGMAYEIMNEYTRLFCPGGDCSSADAPDATVWRGGLEATYDFSNDASLTATDFWSDFGGTWKVYERYWAAATAIQRLQTAIPDFARRFNDAYYDRIRQDASYRPSRTAVIDIIESLAPTLDGRPTRQWIDAQRIFDCRYESGKKTWSSDYSPYSAADQESLTRLHFLESFPGGWEWAQWVPGCPLVAGGTGPYLYTRIHDTAGTVELIRSWDGASAGSSPITMGHNAGQLAYHARGCNDVVGSFAGAEFHLLPPGTPCSSYYFPDPVCFERLPEFGLYTLIARWNNPHYGFPPGPPGYGMPYDATQNQIETRFPSLAGMPPAGFDGYRHVWVGGIRGATEGTLRVSHSTRPGSVTVPVHWGAFYMEPPTCYTWPPDGSCWVRWYDSWTTSRVSVPGTLSFEFTPAGSTTPAWTEQRTIALGSENYGRHRFLLNASDLIFANGFEP